MNAMPLESAQYSASSVLLEYLDNLPGSAMQRAFLGTARSTVMRDAIFRHWLSCARSVMTISKRAASWNKGIVIVAVALICSLATLIPVQAQNAEPSAWAEFRNVWNNVTSYSATVVVFERAGTEVQSSVLDYTFRKPSSATVRFTAGPNAGATVVWNGGDTVVAHRGTGLAALFKRTFSLHDPHVTTIRRSSIDQLSFAAILAHSHETPGIVSQDAGPAILDIPTEAVTLVPISSVSNTGLTREVVDISVPTGLPLRILGYEGSTLVRQIDFSNIILRQ